MRARYSRQQGYVIARRRTTTRPTVRTVQRKLTFGPTTAKYFGLVVLAILAIVMLTRSSASSADAYQELQLNKEIGSSEQKIEEMKLEAKRAQSIQEIQNTALKDQMQPMQNVEYPEKGEVAGASTAKP
jgi:hypothetical protein